MSKRRRKAWTIQQEITVLCTCYFNWDMTVMVVGVDVDVGAGVGVCVCLSIINSIFIHLFSIRRMHTNIHLHIPQTHNTDNGRRIEEKTCFCLWLWWCTATTNSFSLPLIIILLKFALFNVLELVPVLMLLLVHCISFGLLRFCIDLPFNVAILFFLFRRGRVCTFIFTLYLFFCKHYKLWMGLIWHWLLLSYSIEITFA